MNESPDEDAPGIIPTCVSRAKRPGVVARWTKPVVIATSPALEEHAAKMRLRLGCEMFSEDQGPTVCNRKFKSGDPNVFLHWQRIVGRKVIFLFDTVDQSALFEQLAILQALQGFAVPDSEDRDQKWKSYVNRGKYSWARAAHVTVVLPWYRPCQMERTSRWHLVDGKWTNSHPRGEWIDIPTGQYLARLLSTPGSVPPLPGPSEALDGMPINPLWRPPLELLFIELHEEVPISHSANDLGIVMKMLRFVPYFLKKFKASSNYSSKANTFILFPDAGAYKRYQLCATVEGFDLAQLLYMEKSRVGESISQKQQIFFKDNDIEEKLSFAADDQFLIIDDFTNSGSTLFGAVNLLNSMIQGGGTAQVSIYVSHLVAAYDLEVVSNLVKKLHSLGPTCKFFTTNTIPVMTNALKDVPQTEVLDIADFLADYFLDNAS